MNGKREVTGHSGLCRSGAAHRACRVTWETPSVVVRCDCACHLVVVKKGLVINKTPVQGKVVMKKVLHG